jgi:uncharacterized protein (TIGR04255 family)
LNEAVVGVQFEPAKKYHQILAGDVWKLFKADFPHVEEKASLQQSFEVFGPFQPPRINFDFVSGAMHDRFWFIAQNMAELIQFQQDRLLHNWRKVGDETNDYPRFESMMERFTSEIEALAEFFNSLAPQELACNQAEISYINHIPLLHDGVATRAADWLSFLKFANDPPDDAAGVLSRVLVDTKSKPIGRLFCEYSSFAKPNIGTTISLILTVRGAPESSSIASAVEFLKFGREVIVAEFATITTDSAHKAWGRVK